jgi:hypothetical protein
MRSAVVEQEDPRTAVFVEFSTLLQFIEPCFLEPFPKNVATDKTGDWDLTVTFSEVSPVSIRSSPTVFRGMITQGFRYEPSAARQAIRVILFPLLELGMFRVFDKSIESQWQSPSRTSHSQK